MGKTQRNVCLAALMLLAGCAEKEEIGPARYGLDDCRRVVLQDATHGAVVRGAEDLALDADGARLFISAYDRRAVEKAARKRRDVPPHGGIYAVSLETLFDPRTKEVSVSSLAAPKDFAGGLRPHGLSYDSKNHELVFINRTYVREGRRWRMAPQLQRIGGNGEVFVGAPAPAHCAANDVAANEDHVVMTFDHASCGFGASFENIFRLKRSGLADENGPLFSRASFANGVVRLDGGDIAMAATRESSILLLEPAEDGFSERARIELPGRPDNLTLARGEAVIAAVHTSLSKLAMARKFGIGKAPSRIVSANPATGVVDILFDDPKAELFSAATAAVETETGLVAGSVLDQGLLVCRAGG